MFKKPTDELLSQLKESNNINSYMKENQSNLIQKSLAEYLNELLEQKKLKKADVIRKSEVNEIYSYHIFSGKRTPSRDKLICICLGMDLKVEEINQALKYAGYGILYARNKRDSIIIWGIEHGQSILQINESLYEHKERILN